MGLARQILVADAFGTQASIEAFNAANRVSETLFNLVAGGALSSAFIPTFTALLSQKHREQAWKLASSIANLVLLVTILIAVIAWVFAPWIVRNLLAPGFANDPVKESLTISLMQLMLPSAVIFGLSGLVMGVLNSHQIFLLPALAPALYQFGLIIGVLVFAPTMGIVGLGWGVLIGATLHLLFQLPALFNLHGKYVFSFGLRSPDVREVARLMAPRLLGVAVVQLNFWINTRLASNFMEGSVTGVVLGFTLMLMPQAAIAQSIAIAALPTFSAQAAQGRFNELRHSLASSLRAVVIFSIPASIGLMILREPIIEMLYQRGEFNYRSTQLVAWALLWFVAGLLGHSLVEILSRAFYSLHDTKTPVLIGIAAMSTNIGLSYLFSSLFIKIGWLPHGGLALANSTATALEAAALFYLMRRRLIGLETRYLIDGFWRTLGASLIMAAAILGWQAFGRPSPNWVEAIGGILIGTIIFLISAWVIKISEFQELVGFVKMRLTG